MMNGYDHTQMQNNNEGEGAYTIFLGGRRRDAGAPDWMYCRKSMCLHSMEFSRCEQAIQWQIPEVALAFVCFSKCSYMSYSVGQYTTIAERR